MHRDCPANFVLAGYLFAVLALSASCARDERIEGIPGNKISAARLDSFLESKMKELSVPGLSMAVINDGKVVHHRAMGFANAEQKLPVTDKTIFEGASLSKSVFAFFVMTYVDQGKLDLDKPLYEYYPYSDIAYDERYKKITARMVLSHRSGFPNWRTDEGDDVLKIKFEPGTGYLYSGEGYQYLAMVLREIEGTDWKGLQAIFQERVGHPIALEHTVFIQTPYTISYKAEPHDGNGKRIEKEDEYDSANAEFGAAYSIHTESLDFSKWMIAVMNEELLSEASYAELFKPHSDVSSGVLDVDYSLGFLVPRFPFAEDIYLHAGHNSGFTCWFALDVEEDNGFVIFTNSDSGEQLGEDLLYFMMTGLTTPQLLVVGIALAVIFLFGVGFLIWFAIRKWRRRGGTGRLPDYGSLFKHPKVF